MRYRFGVFEFDDSTLRLTRGGQPVHLEAQPSRALALLLKRRGELVTKDDLRNAIWPNDTHVDFDRGIAYCLSEIRTALHDSGANPRFLQTLPKSGYRIIAPIATRHTIHRRAWFTAAGLAATAASFWTYQTLTKPTVLAISIFDNETGREDLDPWVATLSDLVVTDLTTLAPRHIHVIGNAAPLRQPRNIRRIDTLRNQLKADYLLLGQLQKQDTGLRFITHLIRLSDGVHLKANRIPWPTTNTANLDTQVLQEFRNAVTKHLLHQPEVPTKPTQTKTT